MPPYWLVFVGGIAGGCREPALSRRVASMPAARAAEVSARGAGRGDEPVHPHDCPAPVARGLRRDQQAALAARPTVPSVHPTSIRVVTDLQVAALDVLASEAGALYVVLASDRPNICELVQHGAATDQTLAGAVVAAWPAGREGGALTLRRPAERSEGPEGRALLRALSRSPTELTQAVVAPLGQRGEGAPPPSALRSVGGQSCPGLGAYLRDWAARAERSGT